MRQKTWLAMSLLLACALCGGLAFIAYSLLVGCWPWECAPARSVSITDLMLPVELFPKGAIVSQIHPMSDEFETTDDGAQSAHWDRGNGTCSYWIYLYPSVKTATTKFLAEQYGYTHALTKRPLLPTDKLTFSSVFAEQTFIGCGTWPSIPGYHCAMVAQYQEFVIIFSSTIDEQMTYPMFERILAHIDQQMTSLLVEK